MTTKERQIRDWAKNAQQSLSSSPVHSLRGDEICDLDLPQALRGLWNESEIFAPDYWGLRMLNAALTDIALSPHSVRLAGDAGQEEGENDPYFTKRAKKECESLSRTDLAAWVASHTERLDQAQRCLTARRSWHTLTDIFEAAIYEERRDVQVATLRYLLAHPELWQKEEPGL